MIRGSGTSFHCRGCMEKTEVRRENLPSTTVKIECRYQDRYVNNLETKGERMDKFEETTLSMTGMSLAEREEASKKLAAMCNCPSCPTYNRCAKNAQELLFCAKGKSFMCISEEKNCICPACPVASELGLKNKFFCTRGSETTQRYEHGLWGTKMI
jgi:hypothetical protein